MLEDGHIFLRELQPGPLHGVYLVQDAKALTARNGKPYMALTLKDRSGSVSAKRWDSSADDAQVARPGDYLEVQGEVELYRNAPQLVIAHMRRPEPEAILRDAFEVLPDWDPADLLAEVRQILETLPDQDYRAIAAAYLADDAFMARFEIGPAARQMHHPYRYGLLEHVHSVMKLGAALCDHYAWIDRSLVLLGLFLHDSGKVVELTGEEVVNYSFEGELLGHITIGINMLDRKLQALPDFPPAKGVHLKHIILSHHGEQEFGSPKPPMTAEAQVVHTIEMLDAKMNAFLREQAEAPEQTDALGGLRWSKLLKRRIVTRPPAAPEA